MKTMPSAQRPLFSATAPLRAQPAVFATLLAFLLFSLPTQAQNCAPAPSGLVSWWKGEGNATDSAGANHGTLQNGATFALGNVGQAFSLDGVDDYVQIPDSANLRPAQVTVNAWIKTSTIPPANSIAPAYIVARSGPTGLKGYELAVTYGTGAVRFGVLNGAPPFGELIDNISVADGNWHHVAGSYDGATAKLYLDGVLRASLAYLGGVAYTAGDPLLIGTRQQVGNTSRFNGLIDEVDIYNRALSNAEIQAIYAAGSAGKCEPGLAPVADTQSVTTAEEVSVNITLNGTDPEGAPLSFEVKSLPAHGVLTGTGPNTLSYAPALNYNGPDSFTFVVNDGSQDSAPATVSITVTSVNDNPVANPQTVTTPEDTALPITLTGSDADGDTLTFGVITPPTKGSLSGTGPNLTYTPNANFHGSDSFGFGVNDGNGGLGVATVNITITPVNDAPVANSQSLTTPEDTALAVTLTGSDIDGDALTHFVTTPPAHGALSGTAPNLTYTPAANFNGSDSFSFSATDPSGANSTATINITVNPVNDPPLAANQSVVTDEDTPKSVTLGASDVDGDLLTFTVLTPPAHGVLSGTGSNLTYTPAANFNGSDSFAYTITDGHGANRTATVNVTVTAVNDVPLALNDSAATPAGTTVDIAVLANDSDVDGDSLSVASVAQGAHGSVAINASGSVKYTPGSGFSGTDQFTYTIADGQGGSATASVTVTVTPPPPASGCDLFPIALHAQSLAGKQAGDLIADILNGSQSGNFGWLTWAGSPSVPTLVASLTPPGNSSTYINPDNRSDGKVSVGDWVQGSPGASNSSQVRSALDALKQIDIVVPVWDQRRNRGNNADYRIAGFARVRLISYQLPNQNRITARFLGYVECN